MWSHRGQRRPPFALDPGEHQESVWDYPRPPRIAPDPRLVEVLAGDKPLASTRRALRVMETASPPTFYLPREDVDITMLVPVAGDSMCEWKGRARYFAFAGDRRETPIAWSYEAPTPGFAAIGGHVSFYPGRVACRVGGEQVRAQGGGFYGGWVTDEIVGPWKGEAGTGGW